MNKTILSVIAAVLILGGVATAVVTNNNNSDESSKNETSQTTDAEVMEKKEGEEVMEKTEGDVMEKDGDVMTKSSDERYVTLADFESDKASFDSNTKVYFFHASWCSICAGIEKEINAEPTRIPEGTTFIKTDFDSQTSLRQKYGINSQYTFVQVDNEGNQIAKWSATSLNKAIAGIQS